MVKQHEVLTALKELGGQGTSKQVAEQLKKDGIFIIEYKHPNTLGSIVSTTLGRAKKWGCVQIKYTKKGYTGKRKLCDPTWVFICDR